MQILTTGIPKAFQVFMTIRAFVNPLSSLFKTKTYYQVLCPFGCQIILLLSFDAMYKMKKVHVGIDAISVIEDIL